MIITARKLNLIMTISIVVLILGSVGLTLYANNLLSAKSKKLSETKLEILGVNNSRESALSQKAELIRYKASIELLNKIVPKSKDQALAVAELQAIANDNNITIGSLTFPASELGSKNTSSTSSTAKITQSKQKDGISGVLGVELTMSQLNRKSAPSGSGLSYNQLLNILEAIERNRRTMQIKNIQIQPILKGNIVSGYNPTITINLFVKP